MDGWRWMQSEKDAAGRGTTHQCTCIIPLPSREIAGVGHCRRAAAPRHHPHSATPPPPLPPALLCTPSLRARLHARTHARTHAHTSVSPPPPPYTHTSQFAAATLARTHSCTHIPTPVSSPPRNCGCVIARHITNYTLLYTLIRLDSDRHMHRQAHCIARTDGSTARWP